MSCGFDPNTYPPKNPVVQQTFMGLSIMDFSINLGFNSNSSSLSVNLVKDDANYHTWLDLNGCRDAVTEGYHPWDKKAYPKDLIALYGGTPPYPLHKQDISGDLPYFPLPGSPVYFNYYDGNALTSSCTGAVYRNCEPAFSFPGILTKYDRAWSSSGETYSVSITDPRQILENTKIILDGYAGRSAPADGWFNVDSTRTFDEGWNGYYNIINVFGYYENHRFQVSGKTSGGMEWFAPGSGPLTNEYGASTFRGILPAVDFLISGTNKNYIEAMEPFGGPIYYNEDVRQLGFGGSTNPPFGLQKNLSTGLPYNVHRYAVDLSDLYNLSAYWNPNPPAPGILPDDFRISGESMSLLQLVQQVCDQAGCDFFVWLYVPRHPGMNLWNTHRNYSGIIKVTPIRKDLNIRTGILRDAFDQSIMVPPKGPWVDGEQNSTLVSANLGYEFTDPMSGQMLLGAPRTRVVGVTPLGNYKHRPELWFKKATNAYLDGVPDKDVDDVLKEFLPSSENDGVHLHLNQFPKDEFSDKEERGWNPYSDTSAKGIDGRPDFKQNLPMISNDDYLPWGGLWDDYGGGNGADPFQLNRINSKEWEEDEEETTSGMIDLYPCWGFTSEESSMLSVSLNDIIDRKTTGRPIKGLWWDDDPYRDFHPTDGIFGTLEFYNPGLGKCVAIKNPDADKDGQGENSTQDGNATTINYTVGQVIPGLANKPKLCECNYRAALETNNPDDPCLKHGNPIPGKFISHCKTHSTCTTHEGEEVQSFGNAAGTGNKYHLSEFGCTKGCFVKDNNGKATGAPIVAYYTRDYGEGANKKTKGSPASASDEAWSKTPPGLPGSAIKFILSDEACADSATLSGTDRIVAGVDKTGTAPETDVFKMNMFKKSGGLYSSQCIGVGSRKLCLSHCHDAQGKMTTELNPTKCKEQGNTWFDALTENCNGFTDNITGKSITKDQNPSPGYSNVRTRAVKNSKDELIPIQPRTATIPIDLSKIGFEGGPNGNRNYGAGGARYWYYATVSELRHAAVSKDSWISYLSQLGQFLPCQMFSQNPDPTSKWKELCKQHHNLAIKGGASETDMAAQGNLQNYGQGANGSIITTATRSHSGNQTTAAGHAAGGFPCGEEMKWQQLSPYEKTTMELDIAYKKIQEVATQYYGRKYLMPLPFNPPTNHTCSKPNLGEDDCEEQGFDWGPHGMLSDWFAKFGVGFCDGGNGFEADRATCSANGGFWNDPTEEINKWEIVGAGWPGEDNPLDSRKYDSSYPKNMNFWSADGNLESYVVYPEYPRQHFSGLSHDLDFRGVDPESTSVEGNFTALNDKVMEIPYSRRFVKSQVDPKTHWLPTRADWELQNEKQYYMFRTGDPNSKERTVEIGDDQNGNTVTLKINTPEDYAKIGPEDNIKELKGMGEEERPVFIKGEDASDEYKTFQAMKPYALITIPAAVYYGSVDRRILSTHLGGGKNEICIPLAKCKNANCLTSGWLQGQDPNGIAMQQLQRMAKNVKSMPLLAPDLSRGSLAPAAYKPWHAAVPQQSKHYKWGPWALGVHFGKPEFQIDESVHPAAYGGEARMSHFAMNKVKMALSTSQRYIETGSVTLAGLPAYAFGSQMLLNINGTIEAGPYVTDMSISMGSSGLNTTYNFSTERKFGDLSKMYEDKVKDTQRKIITMYKRIEDETQRTRRGRDQYRR